MWRLNTVGHKAGRQGKGLEEFKLKRRDHEKLLRQARRDRQLISKRLLLNEDDEAESSMDTHSGEQVVELYRKLKHPGQETLETHLKALSKALRDPTAQITFIKLENSVHLLVGHLSGSNAQYRLHSVQCLHQLSQSHHPNVAPACLPATPYLLTYLSGQSTKFTELCLYTLGNLCPDSDIVREKLLAQGIISALANCIETQRHNLAVVEAAAFTLSQLLQAKDSAEKIIPMVLASSLPPHLLSVLTPDPQFGLAPAIECAWCLHYLTCSSVGNVTLLAHGMLSRCSSLLVTLCGAVANGNQEESIELIVWPLLRCVGSLLSSGPVENLSSHLGDGHLLAALCTLAQSYLHSQPSLARECAWVLNNLTADSSVFCSTLLVHNLVPGLIQLLPFSQGINTMVLRVLANIAHKKKENCVQLVQAGLLVPLCATLKMADPEMVTLSLEVLYMLVADSNQVGELFVKQGGLSLLEAIQFNSEEAIRVRAAHILEHHLPSHCTMVLTFSLGNLFTAGSMLSVSSLPRIAVPHPSLPSSRCGGSGVVDQMAEPHNMQELLDSTLQQALRELNLPETQELPKGMKHSELCICVLGSPLPYLSLLLEAGQRSPGDALLCLSPSWLSRVSSTLVVHKAVTFDLGGRTFLSSFEPPRKVTYFLSCEPYHEEEVTRHVECPMGCSGSLERFWGDVLNTRVLLQKAKVHTPTTLALLVPPGEAALEEGSTGGLEVVHLAEESGFNSIRNKVESFLVSQAMGHSDKVVLRCSGGRFVGRVADSSPVFLPLSNRQEVWARLLQLLPFLLPGEAVLLEAFCPPLKPGARVESRTWEAYTGCRPQGPDLSFRVCAVVTRSPQDIPLLYRLVCRVGASDAPLSHCQSLCQSLETTLAECGFTEPNMVASVRRLATNTALECLRIIMERESSMSPEHRGGSGAQTDMIGVDMLLTSDGCSIQTVVLGFHPSLCLQSSLPEEGKEMEISDSEMKACQGTLLLTPLTRSQCYLMAGKMVLVIGAGFYSKKFIWEAAKRNNIKILLVDCDPNHFASKMVFDFLPLPDLPDHRRDEQHCIRICDWLTSSGLRPDGCVCFWDDCVVLASLVCATLGLRGAPPEAVRIAKEKSHTHLHLMSLMEFMGTQPVSAQTPSGQADSQAELKNGARRGVIGTAGDNMRALADLDSGNLFSGTADQQHGSFYAPSTRTFLTPHSSSVFPGTFHPCIPLLSPSPSSYAIPCLHLESALDLKKAAQPGPALPGQGGVGMVKFPAVMKLEHGAGAVGVRKVESLTESLAHFERIGGDLREETDYPGIGLGWGNAMTLMEYVGGTEHDVDVLLFNGQLEGAFVSDNGPTRAPIFTETAAQMPSGLAPDKRAQLIRAAHHACLACGLRDGVYNVELKMTERGPRLIEINARMGGFYLRDWILELYGVDILLAAFMVACGVQPRLPSATELPARGCYAGVMCVVSQHLQALRSTASPERLRILHEEGALWLMELAADDELISGEYEEPFCNVGVRDTSRKKAHHRLLALAQGLGLHCPPQYDVGYFLSHFN